MFSLRVEFCTSCRASRHTLNSAPCLSRIQPPAGFPAVNCGPGHAVAGPEFHLAKRCQVGSSVATRHDPQNPIPALGGLRRLPLLYPRVISAALKGHRRYEHFEEPPMHHT